MKQALLLLTSVVLSACADSLGHAASEAEVYEAVYEAVARDRGLDPLVHPRKIAVSANGSMPGHRPEHYLDGPSVSGTVSTDDMDFCVELVTRTGCDLDAGSWIAFSEISHEEGEDLVWVTFVERSPDWVSLRYYRAHVVGSQGQKDVSLTLLSAEN